MADWADEAIEKVRQDWIDNGPVGTTTEDFYAQALRDERERCAKIAEDHAERFQVPRPHGDYRDGQYLTAKDIATAIRSDSEGQE